MDFNYNGCEIIDTLKNKGFEAYFVGGCVRDTVLDLEPKDWDITTNAKPQEVINCFSNYRVIETGLKHGTVTLVYNNELFEITTYRIDGDYSDGRRPDNVCFAGKLEDDLSRRDFTINAIAYNHQESFKDFHGGFKDIQNKKIVAIGDKDLRFKEDGLRILRAIRFASTLGFEIEESTLLSMRRNIDCLENISVERIKVELEKMLLGKNVKFVLMNYKDIISKVLPEIVPMFDFNQNNKYHRFDVWEHTANVVSFANKSNVLAFSALFHDIGKPNSYTFSNGQGHFYGHEHESEKIAIQIMNRLKFSNAEKEEISTLVKKHTITFTPTKKFILKNLISLGEERFRNLITLRRSDILGQGVSNVDNDDRMDRFNQVVSMLNDFDFSKPENAHSLSDLNLNGNDLIEIGVKKGPKIGKILNALLELVINEEIENKKNLLLEKAIVLNKK